MDSVKVKSWRTWKKELWNKNGIQERTPPKFDAN